MKKHRFLVARVKFILKFLAIKVLQMEWRLAFVTTKELKIFRTIRLALVKLVTWFFSMSVL
ncbi:hypothetical protein D0N73_27565 [Pseudomonas fluorescens]|nr:hypothetical protein B0A76_20370 [Pseudomonas fluorescens]RFP93193.1 hypothetical protein D0N73_27565 [Pseudomonas fluorescens]